jgi:hypothetical protein
MRNPRVLVANCARNTHELRTVSAGGAKTRSLTGADAVADAVEGSWNVAAAAVASAVVRD